MASCPRLRSLRHTAGGPFFYAATKNRIGRRPPGAAGTGTTPAAFYLGLCRLRAILSPPASVTTYRRRNHSPLRQRRIESDAEDRCHNGCCRRAIPHCSSDDAASIPKFGLEIKNRCTKEGVNGEKLTSIPKFGPEIKNHFSSKSVLQAGHSSLRQRKLELDAESRRRDCRSRRAILLCGNED